MSENVMAIQVITPAGVVYDHHATYILAHTIGGDMGILPNMISTIAGLQISELKVRRPDDVKHVDYIAVNGGIIEVKDRVCSFLQMDLSRGLLSWSFGSAPLIYKKNKGD